MSDLLREFLDWISKIENILTLLGSAFSTFSGAALAFYFGNHQLRRTQRKTNLDYLHYAIASLGGLMSHLCVFKAQVSQPRLEEAEQILKTMRYASGNVSFPIQIKHMGQFRMEPHVEWPIITEKLHFLTNRDPNLITLISSTAAALSSHNLNVVNTNKAIETAMSRPDDALSVPMLASTTLALGQQINATIYFVQKSIELLTKYGQLEFKKEMKIRSVEMIDPAYAAMRPPAIETWENVNWFPQKKTVWRRFLRLKLRTSES